MEGLHHPAMDTQHHASSPASTSPVESSSNATTTAHEQSRPSSEIGEADIGTTKAREEEQVQSRNAMNEDTSDSESDSDSEDISEELQHEEDERDEHHSPRQGLPSFLHALTRLNLRDPGSIMRSLK